MGRERLTLNKPEVAGLGAVQHFALFDHGLVGQEQNLVFGLTAEGKRKRVLARPCGGFDAYLQPALVYIHQRRALCIAIDKHLRDTQHFRAVVIIDVLYDVDDILLFENIHLDEYT